MAYSVLILDDDADFNSLLTDIFEQADYIVSSLDDPIEALEVFEQTDYDLVVTDQKMPEMSGSEFMKAIKKIKPQVPVIMVSGYLENDTIRALIGEGVGGVFLKPLNIFSLLERTTELIEESRKVRQNSGEQGGTPGDSDVEVEMGPLGFAFRSFPCKSKKSSEFADRLYGLRNFKSTLSLIGEKGTHYRAICEDIQGFYESAKEHFVYLSPNSFDENQVLTLVDAAKKSGAERITCVLLELEAMTDTQKLLAAALAKGDGVFQELSLSTRTIFTISGDLDAFFDEGLIDENLYILMGTAEVRVPTLRECPNDLSVMAQQLVVDAAREQGRSGVPQFDKAARDFIKKHPWEGNYAELRETVRKAVDAHSGGVLTLTALIAAVNENPLATPRARLEAHLSKSRIDYVRALSILFGGDWTKVATFLGVDTEAIEALLK